MTAYTQQIKSYLNITPLPRESSQFDSLLKMLWYFYTLYYPVNCSTVEEKLQCLEPILKTLSRKRYRRLINTVANLCAKYEQAAFLEGIRVGAMLILEISE